MKMKRLIATALAAAMIFGLVSVGLAASETLPDVKGHEFEHEIRMLATLGVIAGYPDGEFKAENTLTRAEFTALIVRMLGQEKMAEAMAGDTVPFSDVPSTHWASGHILIAEALDIIGGYPDGTFRPEAAVTHAEAVKMILAAMGYVEEGYPVVRWPVTWLLQASELELDKGVDLLANLPITRGEVSKLLHNSLGEKHVKVVEGEFKPKGTDGSEVAFLSKLGVKQLKDQVVTDTPELWDNDSEKVHVGDEELALEDYEGLYGHKVRVWKNKDILVVKDLSTEKVLTAKEYKKIDKPALYFVNYTQAELGEEQDGKVDVSYKGEEFDVNEADEIIAVYDDKGVIIAIKAFKYETAVVDDIYGGYKRQDLYLPERVALYDFGVEYRGVDDFDDIKKHDVVRYIYDEENEHALIIVTRDVVVGKLTEITYAGDLKVDGVVYKIAKGATVDPDDEDVGATVTLYLDKDGKVYKYEGKEEAKSDIVYGVFKGTATRWVKDDKETFAKILTVDGEKEYLVLAGAISGDAALEKDNLVSVELEAGEAQKITVLGEGVSGKITKITSTKITVKGDGDELEQLFEYDSKTLWLELDDDGLIERPKPGRDHEVKLYLDEDNVVVIGVVGEIVSDD